MLARKRSVVQLTALLDLLFIMIFISLSAEHQRGSERQVLNESLQDKIAEVQAQNKNLVEHGELKDKEQMDTPRGGHYRKLFATNNRYKTRSGSYKYRETIIYSADEATGLYEYRVNLIGKVIETRNNKPLTPENANQIKQCSSVEIRADRIYQDCTVVFGRRKVLDCDRKDAKHYLCTEVLYRDGGKSGRERLNQWEYIMQLIKIYDPSLVL